MSGVVDYVVFEGLECVFEEFVFVDLLIGFEIGGEYLFV